MKNSRPTKAKSYIKAFFELLPSLTSIFLGDLLLVFLFLNLAREKLSLEFFVYVLLEAASLFCLGKLSDKWSRKNVLITIHIMTLPLLGVLYFYIQQYQMTSLHLENHIYYLFAAGLIYSPGPPCRAILVDNYKSTIIRSPNNNFYDILNLTETRIISISWIAQYLPWALAPVFALVSRSEWLLVLIVLMALNIPFLTWRLVSHSRQRNRNQLNFK